MEVPLEHQESSTLAEDAGGWPMRLLLLDTTRWALGARLAAAFIARGCKVGIVRLGKGHPADCMASISARFQLRGLQPTRSIRDAIHKFRPDLILPVCDRSVGFLHKLHAQAQSTGDNATARCIEHSIGPAESYGVVDSRYELLRIAAEEGVRTPAIAPIRDTEDLCRFALTQPLPWAIKADRSWGGQGVHKAATLAEAEAAFRRLGRCPGVGRLLALLATNRDRALHLGDWLQPDPAISAQSWIDGAPANCAVVCWKGEVLAAIAVEVKATASPMGPSRRVEVVDGGEMLRAARRVAARLQLSGFAGFDFMVEKGSGSVYLIEMNARCTPCCALQMGKGSNLPAAFVARITGLPEPDEAACTTLKTIAYFPHSEWGANQPTSLAAHCYYDVPAEAPELMPILLRPWRERGLLGVLVDKIAARRKPSAKIGGVAGSSGQENGAA